MMPSITEEAKQIIDGAPDHGPLRPIPYAEALPAKASVLARVLREQRITDAAERFRYADEAAIDAQKKFVKLGRRAAYSGFLAAVLGGFLLYLPPDSTDSLRTSVGVAQLFFLIVSMLHALALFLSKPYRIWRTERGTAEALRQQIFAHIMSGEPQPNEPNGSFLLPLQLECFRRHLLHDQRNFFARRGPQHHRTVLVWKGAGVVAIVLILAAALPEILKLYQFGLLPENVRSLMVSIPLNQKGYALLGLIGGCLQGLLAALTVISPAERNAHMYKVMRDRLDGYTRNELDGVRALAAAGDRAAVSGFASKVGADLAREPNEWQILQAVLSEKITSQLIHQHEVMPSI
jgi:hypothetical protein